MGIDGDITKRDKENFSGGLKSLVYTSVPSIEGGFAFLEDSLTRVLWNPGENDWLYTGESFYQMWYKPFRDYLTQACTHCVSTFDASENVPKEKAQTQLARIIAGNKSQAKKEAASGEKRKFYTEDMRFEDGGIYDPKGRETSLQMFDLRIVQAGPRGVRKHLWNYVFNKLKHETLPDNRVLYLETDCQSAWKFEGTKEFTRDLKTAHGHGESDPSLAFWLEFTCFNVKEGKTALIRSKDGDCIPILLHAIEMQEIYAPANYVRKPVYWMQSYQNIYDMRVYHNKVKTKYSRST